MSRFHTYFIPDALINAVHNRIVSEIIERVPAKQLKDASYFIYKYASGEKEVSVYARYRTDQIAIQPTGKYDAQGQPLDIEIKGEKSVQFVGQNLPNIIALLDVLGFTKKSTAFFRRMQCTLHIEHIDFTFRYDINSRNQRCLTIEVPLVGPIANVEQVIAALEVKLQLKQCEKLTEYEFV